MGAVYLGQEAQEGTAHVEHGLVQFSRPRQVAPVQGQANFRGVRVNAASSGPTRTEGTAGMGDGLDQLASLAPAGRPASPEEAASAIVYLASDQASFVHGAVLAVGGGRTAT
jgi:NAD(P)-dependent dehydrogenase (short-subunit alcohol dehydrogenase family)